MHARAPQVLWHSLPSCAVAVPCLHSPKSESGSTLRRYNEERSLDAAALRQRVGHQGTSEAVRRSSSTGRPFGTYVPTTWCKKHTSQMSYAERCRIVRLPLLHVHTWDSTGIADSHRVQTVPEPPQHKIVANADILLSPSPAWSRSKSALRAHTVIRFSMPLHTQRSSAAPTAASAVTRGFPNEIH